MAKLLDKTDREIIRQLREDGRASNQQIAEALGLNAATVAARIKRMEDDNQMRVVAVSDFAAHGFQCLLRVAIKAESRPLSEIARDIAQLPEMLAVHIVSGSHDLDALIGIRDVPSLSEQLRAGISAVRGIRYYAPSVVLDIIKYRFDVAPISQRSPVPGNRTAARDATLPVDELDLALIDALSRDARVANSTIADELDVTEGTVRSRIKRLQQRKLMTFTAVTSLEAARKAQLGFVYIEADPAHCAAVTGRLAEMPTISAVLLLTGRLNIMAVCLEERVQDIFGLVSNTIIPIEGVRSVETSIVVESVMHNSLMARLQL